MLATIVQSIIWSTVMAKIINVKRAREIAQLWHGGQSSPLYAFASTGQAQDVDAVLYEVDHCLSLHLATARDKIELNRLRAYLLRWHNTQRMAAALGTAFAGLDDA
jgi:hypothetical protein